MKNHNAVNTRTAMALLGSLTLAAALLAGEASGAAGGNCGDSPASHDSSSHFSRGAVRPPSDVPPPGTQGN